MLRVLTTGQATSGTVPVANPNADGSPTSRHTYSGLAYDSDRDSLFMMGGAVGPHLPAKRVTCGSFRWDR